MPIRQILALTALLYACSAQPSTPSVELYPKPALSSQASPSVRFFQADIKTTIRSSLSGLPSSTLVKSGVKMALMLDGTQFKLRMDCSGDCFADKKAHTIVYDKKLKKLSMFTDGVLDTVNNTPDLQGFVTSMVNTSIPFVSTDDPFVKESVSAFSSRVSLSGGTVSSSSGTGSGSVYQSSTTSTPTPGTSLTSSLSFDAGLGMVTQTKTRRVGSSSEENWTSDISYTSAITPRSGVTVPANMHVPYKISSSGTLKQGTQTINIDQTIEYANIKLNAIDETYFTL
ncbi:MAG: hypothetical protein U0Z75_01005 [Deinococcaceae bacterium]